MRFCKRVVPGLLAVMAFHDDVPNRRRFKRYNTPGSSGASAKWLMVSGRSRRQWIGIIYRTRSA